MRNQAPFILVDGSSYLYRAFHAMPNLRTVSGVPTGAIYGVTNMLRKLITDYEPRHVAVVFDAKGKTFRNDIYKEYKAHRPPMPDELREQVATIHEIVDAMGLPRLVIDGVEADDVIGTLATQASDQGMDTLVCTGDKDLAQLVDDHVTLINTMNDTRLDADGVQEKFGVPPQGIVDYLMLVGDSSDNIPGVPKVGPKTAVKWLAEYRSLEELVSRAGEVGGKVGEHLRAAIDQCPMTRELVTIRRGVELGQGPRDLERRPPDRKRLRELFTKLEFRAWLD
ncbi:MAG TPA: DNA polymerase I, partial [Actinobacteria bacterium]|nr:DNA polymerase I [Actinomycetota bacterium]